MRASVNRPKARRIRRDTATVICNHVHRVDVFWYVPRLCAIIPGWQTSVEDVELCSALVTH